MAQVGESKHDRMLGWALAYANRGFYVLPLWWIDERGRCACGQANDAPKHKPGKHPIGELVPNGSTNASNGVAEITAWWTKYPEANIGIRLGSTRIPDERVLAVDIDPRSNGPQAWWQFVNGREMGFVVEARSGSGGSHLLLNVPASEKFPFKFLEGVELLCDGRYIVAPPSNHLSGENYTWVLSPLECSFSPAPIWFLEELRERIRAIAKSTHQDTSNLEKYGDGYRNAFLVHRRGQIARLGFTDAAVFEALKLENKIRCMPPLSEERVRQIAYSSKATLGNADDAPRPAVEVPRFKILTVEEMTAPLGPIPWVCEPLKLAPGFPTMVAGYGFAGKTVAVQQWMIAKASGKLAFDEWSMGEAAPVVHMDWDQGRRTTIERYQRTCYAQEVDLGAIVRSGYLRTCVLPDVFLTEKTIEAELVAMLDGVAMCLVDSMTSALPGVDENSTLIAQYLYMLGRVSERTGCTIIVIHHYRKSNPNAKDEDPAQLIRGNGAIFNALSVGYGISGKRGEPARWTCVKQRHSGIIPEPFDVTVQDVGERPSIGSLPPGLRVRLAQPGDGMSAARAVAAKLKADQALDEKIIRYVGAAPGQLKSKNDIFDVVKGNRGAVLARIDVLINAGRLVFFNGGFVVGRFANNGQ